MAEKLSKKVVHPLGPYFAKKVPCNWLDPLLTGPHAVIGQPPYDRRDIEILLRAVAARIHVSRTRGAAPTSAQCQCPEGFCANDMGSTRYSDMPGCCKRGGSPSELKHP